MSSASGDGLTVSSWRWLDDEGEPTSRSAATFCLWSVYGESGQLGFVALPAEVNAVDALILAGKLWESEYAKDYLKLGAFPK